jgi:hypothetical protein
MHNYLVKVHNQPKPKLLRARMQREQQYCKTEGIQFAKQSYTARVMI